MERVFLASVDEAMDESCSIGATAKPKVEPMSQKSMKIIQRLPTYASSVVVDANE